jgi:hypothetical protein
MLPITASIFDLIDSRYARLLSCEYILKALAKARKLRYLVVFKTQPLNYVEDWCWEKIATIKAISFRELTLKVALWSFKLKITVPTFKVSFM